MTNNNLFLIFTVTLFGVPNFGANFGRDQSNPSGRIDIEDGQADTGDETGVVVDGHGPHDFYDPSEVNPYFFSPSFAEMMNRMQGSLSLIFFISFILHTNI